MHKLWDKGVDIVANVISGGLVALFASVLAVVVIRKRVAIEEKARLQEKKSFEVEELLKSREDIRKRLEGQRSSLADAARAAQNNKEAQAVFNEYAIWLKNNDLSHLASNWKIEKAWENMPSDVISHSVDEYKNIGWDSALPEGTATKFADDILETELPDPNHWNSKLKN
jgi:hypothetical protein